MARTATRTGGPSRLLGGTAVIGLCLMAAAPAAAGDCKTLDMMTELIDGATYCASSVLAPEGGNRYDAARLSYWNGTGDAWCEGVKGPGIGEWVTVAPRPKLPVRTVIIVNGYQKSTKTFADNNRARRIRIATENGTRVEATLADTRGEQRISLPGWERLGRVRVTILSVYPSKRYDDTCLTIVWPDIEEQRELEWQEMNR